MGCFLQEQQQKYYFRPLFYVILLEYSTVAGSVIKALDCDETLNVIPHFWRIAVV